MRDLDYLEDIRVSGEKALEFLGASLYEVFLEDEKTQVACIRQSEVIGEAVKRLSQETRDLFQIFLGVNGRVCGIYSSTHMIGSIPKRFGKPSNRIFQHYCRPYRHRAQQPNLPLFPIPESL